MKKYGLMLLVMMGFSFSAHAEVWIARCNNLQFNFDLTRGSALIYFNTSAGIFQMAKGSMTFNSGTSVQAVIDGNSTGYGGQTLTEVGLNRSRNIVYVQYRNPTTGALSTGAFCSTPIEIR